MLSTLLLRLPGQAAAWLRSNTRGQSAVGRTATRSKLFAAREARSKKLDSGWCSSRPIGQWVANHENLDFGSHGVRNGGEVVRCRIPLLLPPDSPDSHARTFSARMGALKFGLAKSDPPPRTVER